MKRRHSLPQQRTKKTWRERWRGLSFAAQLFIVCFPPYVVGSALLFRWAALPTAISLSLIAGVLFGVLQVGFIAGSIQSAISRSLNRHREDLVAQQSKNFDQTLRDLRYTRFLETLLSLLAERSALVKLQQHPLSTQGAELWNEVGLNQDLVLHAQACAEKVDRVAVLKQSLKSVVAEFLRHGFDGNSGLGGTHEEKQAAVRTLTTYLELEEAETEELLTLVSSDDKTQLPKDSSNKELPSAHA